MVVPEDDGVRPPLRVPVAESVPEAVGDGVGEAEGELDVLRDCVAEGLPDCETDAVALADWLGEVDSLLDRERVLDWEGVSERVRVRDAVCDAVVDRVLVRERVPDAVDDCVPDCDADALALGDWLGVTVRVSPDVTVCVGERESDGVMLRVAAWEPVRDRVDERVGVALADRVWLGLRDADAELLGVLAAEAVADRVRPVVSVCEGDLSVVPERVGFPVERCVKLFKTSTGVDDKLGVPLGLLESDWLGEVDIEALALSDGLPLAVWDAVRVFDGVTLGLCVREGVCVLLRDCVMLGVPVSVKVSLGLWVSLGVREVVTLGVPDKVCDCDGLCVGLELGVGVCVLLGV